MTPKAFAGPPPSSTNNNSNDLPKQSFELKVGNYAFLEPPPFLLSSLLHVDAVTATLFAVAFVAADKRIQGRRKLHYYILIIILLPTFSLSFSHTIVELRRKITNDDFTRVVAESDASLNGLVWNTRRCGRPNCLLDANDAETSCRVKITPEMCAKYDAAENAAEWQAWMKQFLSKAYLPLPYLLSCFGLVTLTLMIKRESGTRSRRGYGNFILGLVVVTSPILFAITFQNLNSELSKISVAKETTNDDVIANVTKEFATIKAKMEGLETNLELKIDESQSKILKKIRKSQRKILDKLNQGFSDLASFIEESSRLHESLGPQEDTRGLNGLPLVTTLLQEDVVVESTKNIIPVDVPSLKYRSTNLGDQFDMESFQLSDEFLSCVETQTAGLLAGRRWWAENRRGLLPLMMAPSFTVVVVFIAIRFWKLLFCLMKLKKMSGRDVIVVLKMAFWAGLAIVALVTYPLIISMAEIVLFQLPITSSSISLLSSSSWSSLSSSSSPPSAWSSVKQDRVVIDLRTFSSALRLCLFNETNKKARMTQMAIFRHQEQIRLKEFLKGEQDASRVQHRLHLWDLFPIVLSLFLYFCLQLGTI